MVVKWLGAGWVRPWGAWQAPTLMVEWGVADKLLFGSDFPFWTPREGFDKLRRVGAGRGHRAAAQIEAQEVRGRAAKQFRW